MGEAAVGIIGGSGIYDLPGLTDLREENIASPWGEPSDTPLSGRIGAVKVVFLPRHGRGHRLSPSGINYRANIDALKRCGVTDIVSLSACGSFKAELYPGDDLAVGQHEVRWPNLGWRSLRGKGNPRRQRCAHKPGRCENAWHNKEPRNGACHESLPCER